ncbi:MAG TPA: hypothetical protein VFD70_09310 [Anaerolineae bacterium]|nr:hypothetical protein [Anaerolineae bacterium]
MEIHVANNNSWLDSLLDTNQVYEGVGDLVIPNATEEKLIDALAAMERGDTEFVILSDGNRFMQAAGDARSGYTLEYNEGSAKEQYRAKNTKISGADLTAAFVVYLHQDPAWRDKFIWEKFRL